MRSSIPTVAALALCLMTLSCRFANPATRTPDGFTAAARATGTALASTPTEGAASARCPVPPSEPSLGESELRSQPVIAVTDYLNRGGDPEQLADQLMGMGFMPEDTPAIVQPDFDADGWLDLALVLTQPDSKPPQGKLFAFGCTGDSYQLLYTTPETTLPDLPIVHRVGDLNPVQGDDLLLGIESCGAHTCQQQMSLLTLMDGSLKDRWAEDTSDLPSPHLEIEAQDGASTVIRITAQGVNSVGAGPYRQFQRAFTWNPTIQQFELAAETTLPSNYRIHVLHDADTAFLQGEYETALEGYRQVREDETLQDWVAPEVERRTLGAYALFRSLVTHLQMDDVASAREALAFGRAAYNQGEVGWDFIAMADLLWKAAEVEGGASFDLATGCAAARNYAVTHPEGTLDSLYYGYTNPSYAPEDLCPVEG